MIKNKKIIAIILLILTIFSSISPIVLATEISEANIQDRGKVEQHLQYWNEDQGAWYYVTTTYTTYSVNGREYPAYCLNREYAGVGELDGYTACFVA